MVSVPAVSVVRFAGAHGSGDGLGLAAAASLGEAAADAATEAAGDGAMDGAGVGVAAPEHAATSTPTSARATAGRIGVRMVRRFSSVSGPARVYPSGQPRRGPRGLQRASSRRTLG